MNAQIIDNLLNQAEKLSIDERFKVLPLSRQGASLFGELKLALRQKRAINSENIKKHNFDLILATESLIH